jgi:ABC-type Fe3+ transport system permease subunit
MPTLWLMCSSFEPRSFAAVLTAPFLGALKRTLVLFTAVIAGALVLGWPAGTLMGLVPFSGQRLLFAALAVPLLTPSSLWAVGISLARPWFAYRHQWWLDGFWGALLAGLVQALPLVLLASALLVRVLPWSQIDWTLLSNGWPALLVASARFSLPAAVAAAVLGGLIVIADPGAAQIMGYHGMATEIPHCFGRSI